MNRNLVVIQGCQEITLTKADKSYYNNDGNDWGNTATDYNLRGLFY